MTILLKKAISEQSRIPHAVGRTNARRVHRMLPVSRRIVQRVVEQGQCRILNSITQTAVTAVQPFSDRKEIP